MKYEFMIYAYRFANVIKLTINIFHHLHFILQPVLDLFNFSLGKLQPDRESWELSLLA